MENVGEIFRALGRIFGGYIHTGSLQNVSFVMQIRRTLLRNRYFGNGRDLDGAPEEPYIFTNMPDVFAKETNTFGIKRQRALYNPQKGSLYSAKEPYVFCKRDLCIPQKSPIYIRKKSPVYAIP